jgi:hypothetical protein
MEEQRLLKPGLAIRHQPAGATRGGSALLRSVREIVICCERVEDRNSGRSCACAHNTALLCLIHAYDNAARFVMHRSRPVVGQYRILQLP